MGMNHKMATILLYPKLRCPVGCAYCFSNPIVPPDARYDKAAMIERLEETYKKDPGSIILHGGEVLSLPLKDFEFFLKAADRLSGSSHIQTSCGAPHRTYQIV